MSKGDESAKSKVAILVVPPVTPQTERIDTKLLSQHTNAQAVTWLNTNQDAFFRLQCDRLYKLLSTGKRDGILPQAPCYGISQEMIDAVDTFLETAPTFSKQLDYLTQPISHIYAYCYRVFSDYSCHRAIYGEDRQVELPGPERYFLDLYAAAPDEMRSHIEAALLHHRENCVNPSYTTAARAQEIRTLHGEFKDTMIITFPEFRVIYSPVARVEAALKKEYQPESSTIETLPDKKVRHGVSDILFYYAMVLSCTMNVSADFLLIQDYSRLAVRDGEPLSEKEQHILSLFLTCNVDARLRLLSDIITCNIEDAEVPMVTNW